MENKSNKNINNNFNIEISKEELEYIHKILTCLENTFKSTDKDIRKQSEKFLKETEINLFSHLIQIFNFIKQKTISKELCNALLIFIRNSIACPCATKFDCVYPNFSPAAIRICSRTKSIP